MPTTMSTGMDAETRERLAAPAVRAFFRISDVWGITDLQRLALLGESVSRSTLPVWRARPPRTLSRDQLERCSYVAGIYEGLTRIFRRDPDLGGQWLRLPRPEFPFLGQSALSYMLGGGLQQMAEVRAYVDHINGGPPSREAYPTPAREA